VILLCIDTALASCSTCVYDSAQNTILAEERELMERGHAEALPPMVARVMAKAGVGYQKLDRVAVTTGPGTFTGIRIGLSFARALGLSLNINVLGLNTMIATQVAVSQAHLPICVAHKAGASGFLYFYNAAQSQNIVSISLDEVIARLPKTPFVIVGTAAEMVAETSKRRDIQLSPQHDLPRASGFAAYAAVLSDSRTMPEPVYLRDADAKPQITPLRSLPDLKIRLADVTDVTTIAKLHALCFEEAWEEAAIHALLGSPGTGCLIAHSAEGPAGFLMYRAVADEAEILTLGVDPNLRRRGGGKALLDALIALKIKTVFLEVASNNVDALRLYTNAGFQTVGVRKNYYARSGDDALVLRREA
jgi:tRNA threonylcarbamoyl adenosine modification protein YeaZ/ribosomal-protein-alanine acetyltransferase